MEVKVAISQKPPVLLDLDATIDRALATLDEVAANGARLVVFPEAYLPGYPTWIWRLRPGGYMALGNKLHAELRKNAVDIGAGGRCGSITDQSCGTVQPSMSYMTTSRFFCSAIGPTRPARVNRSTSGLPVRFGSSTSPCATPTVAREIFSRRGKTLTSAFESSPRLRRSRCT